MKIKTILSIYAISLCLFIDPATLHATEKSDTNKNDVSPILDMIKKSQKKDKSMQSISFGGKKDAKETEEAQTPDAEATEQEESTTDVTNTKDEDLSPKELWNKYKTIADKNRNDKKEASKEKTVAEEAPPASEEEAQKEDQNTEEENKQTNASKPEKEKGNSAIQSILENYKNATKSKDDSIVNSRSFGSID